MPKIITQHRRGTKDEWESSGIKPAKGEIVLEQEGINTKIKVGTGSDYSQLPYITDAVSEEVATERHRINNLIKYVEDNGSANPLGSVESELIDIRNGYDGTDYSVAGDAVRAIGNQVNTLEKNLSNFINADAVDGLMYEDNMLWLTADGQMVGDPVEVIGGGGGGPGTGTTTVVRVINKKETTRWSIVTGAIAEIQFEFISTEDGMPTGDGSYTIYINNVARLKGSAKQGIDNIVNVTKYLQTGENKVKLVCEDIFGVY